jgi:hypothetical protein
VWLPAVRRVGYDDLRFHDLRHAAEDRDRLIADRLGEMTAEAGLATVAQIADRRLAASDA